MRNPAIAQWVEEDHQRRIINAGVANPAGMARARLWRRGWDDFNAGRACPYPAGRFADIWQSGHDAAQEAAGSM